MTILKQLVTAAGLMSAGTVGAYCLGGKVVSAAGQDTQLVQNSYMSVDDKESFAALHSRMAAAKVGL